MRNPLRRRWLSVMCAQERRREFGCYQRLVEVLHAQRRALEAGDQEAAESLMRRKKELVRQAGEAAERFRTAEAQLVQIGGRPVTEVGVFMPVLSELVELERETRELMAALDRPSLR